MTLIEKAEKELHTFEKVSMRTASELIEKVKELENKLAELTHECQCLNWESAGNDPLTGDKYKRCLDCDKVSIR